VVELLEYSAVLVETEARDLEELVQDCFPKAVRGDEQTGWRCRGHIEEALRRHLEEYGVVNIHGAGEVRQVNMGTDLDVPLTPDRIARKDRVRLPDIPTLASQLRIVRQANKGDAGTVSDRLLVEQLVIPKENCIDATIRDLQGMFSYG
jgi:hypothetical protein